MSLKVIDSYSESNGHRIHVRITPLEYEQELKSIYNMIDDAKTPADYPSIYLKFKSLKEKWFEDPANDPDMIRLDWIIEAELWELGQ